MASDDPSSLNVLIVDDDPTVVRLLVEIVSSYGHQPVSADSAEEILKLLPFWTFQVALIDHRLPGMEGIVLGDFLRRHNPDMKIALITGAPEAGLEQRCRELGMAFLPKPFTVDDVLSIVDGYLSTAETRDVERQSQADMEFAPPISDYANMLSEVYDLPNIPARVQQRLLETIKKALNNLRSPHRYTERDRITALAGLLTARVLGLRMPKAASERTLFEEYDELMLRRGRRPEFKSR